MQVNETLSKGLEREFQITISSTELEAEVEARLTELSGTVKMKGFRPGKVPLSIVRRQYRPAILGEVLEKTIQSTSQRVLEERDLRPAMQPKIEIIDFDDGKDLQYKMALEVLPKITIGDLSELKLERLVADVDDTQVNDGLKRIADADKQFKKIEEDRPAEKGDALLIDFKGSIEGVDLDGASAEDFEIELGSGSFIPGFEDQLLGVKADQKLEVKVDFPENYPQEDAAGKPAVFDVTVKELRSREQVNVDDEMASRQGFDNLSAMSDMVRQRLGEQYEEASKERLKRSLLDSLSERYEFEVPTGMVEQEFQGIWAQINKDMKESKVDFEEALGKKEKEAEKEYRGIAERRVRLGLLLSAIGSENKLTIEQDDLLSAALEGAKGMSNPQQILEFYRSNPDSLERFRAPAFENKVVTFLTELVEVSDKTVDVEELFRDPDLENVETENKKKKSTTGKGKKPKATGSKSSEKSSKKQISSKKTVTKEKKSTSKKVTKKAKSEKASVKVSSKAAKDD